MTAGRQRVRLEVSGLVQGVGFRPFVYVNACELSLTGTVGNDCAGVVIEVEGDPGDVGAFIRRLREQAPALAVVESVRVQPIPPIGGTGFSIAGSQRRGGVRTLASPDVATCADCLRELADPVDRRYRHPFITCTNCGPRFTIITSLPYDRSATTMADFAMCPACAREYADPGDRRFHAQPIACPDCGPRIRLVRPHVPDAWGEGGLAAARALLAEGAILAVKGLGGYHLVCDARNEPAVARLRRRKQRVAKPFAVMARDLHAARRLAVLETAAENLLTGPRRPIVLVPARTAADLAPSVAPGLPDLGLMLPYTPLHVLLFEPGPAEHLYPATMFTALVMTSGNLGGEPIVTDDAEARTRLAPLVDAWLTHDRPIHVPCDDSVVRVVDGEELPIRRSRGYTPLPVALPIEVPATLAVGADLKNTCAVAVGRYAWLGQHIGEMDDAATLEAFGAASRHLQQLTGVAPQQLAADLHPGYRSTGWARRNAAGRPVRTVQHHHAHIAALMAEHGLDGSRAIIGIAFDGTGYGPDGAIWGGEALVADYKGFRRVAHLGYVPLPGGDAAVRRPYRMALAHLAAAGIDWDPALPAVAACPPAELGVLRHQLDTGFGCVPTSSVGRLFDAVASLIGVRHVVDYEAQAAVEFEAVSRPFASEAGLASAGPTSAGSASAGPTSAGSASAGSASAGFASPGSAPDWSASVGLGCPWPAFDEPALMAPPDGEAIADPGPMLRSVVADLKAGVPAGLIGARFHAAMAGLVLRMAQAARAQGGGLTVGLTGGVFQNALLLSGARAALQEDGFTVLTHRQVPANDGGLALGQILVAASS